MNNITQHTILPCKSLLGQYKFDGTAMYTDGTNRTHWYPLNTIGRRIFLTNSNAISVYGDIYGYSSTGGNAKSLTPMTPLVYNVNVLDARNPIPPSKEFTYILI